MCREDVMHEKIWILDWAATNLHLKIDQIQTKFCIAIIVTFKGWALKIEC